MKRSENKKVLKIGVFFSHPFFIYFLKPIFRWVGCGWPWGYYDIQRVKKVFTFFSTLNRGWEKNRKRSNGVRFLLHTRCDSYSVVER